MRFLSAVVRELDIVQAWLVPAAELVQKNLITCNPQGDVAERLGNDVHECQILSVLRDQVLVVRKIVLNKLARFMMYTMSSRSHLEQVSISTEGNGGRTSWLCDSKELGGVYEFGTLATDLESVTVDNGNTIVEGFGTVQWRLDLETDLSGDRSVMPH